MKYQQVFEYFGGHAKAARALGISRQAVMKWKADGIKHSRQLHIQAYTRGKLKADAKEAG